MRNRIFILYFAIFLFACNERKNIKSTNLPIIDSGETIPSLNSEKFYPERIEIVKFDTLIVKKGIHISIIRTDLDSYVTNEYEEGGKKQIDKYRDAEISLKIKQNSKILLDTVFRKEQFSKYADKGFMGIANFHNYWFNKLDKEELEFFGVISQPETDYTLSFYHYFDLTNSKLVMVENTQVEE